MTKIQKAIIGTVVAGSLFLAGSYTEANTNIFSNVITNANKEIGKAGYDKKTEIITNLATNVDAKLNESLSGEIDTKEAEVQAALDAYFNQKVEGITETAEYQNVVTQLDTIKSDVIKRYKAEIDTAFANLK